MKSARNIYRSEGVSLEGLVLNPLHVHTKTLGKMKAFPSLQVSRKPSLQRGGTRCLGDVGARCASLPRTHSLNHCEPSEIQFSVIDKMILKRVCGPYTIFG